MACLNVQITRVGGDLSARFQRIGGDLGATLLRVGGNLDVEFRQICGTSIGIYEFLRVEEGRLKTIDDKYLKVPKG